MTEAVALAPKKISLVETMASEYGMEASPFLEAIKQTVMPGNATNAQTAAFLQVAHQYNLNAFIKEIYAFPTKGGGIMPVIGVDGWISIAQRDPRFNGYEYTELLDEKGKLEGGQVILYYTDEKRRPFTHREWFNECKRNTDPWNNMPRRMMENRTTAQGIRKGLGIHGVMDIDEAEQMNEINVTAESSVMSRETQSRAEVLKEKIGAKKAEKAKEAPKEPEIVVPTVQEADVNFETGEIKEPEESLFPEETQPDRVLTDAERNAVLAILKTKGDASDPDRNDKIMTAARKYFLSIGANSTKELKLSQLAQVTEWANNLTV